MKPSMRNGKESLLIDEEPAKTSCIPSMYKSPVSFE